MASVRQARSAVGNTIKYHPDDHEAIQAARGDLTVAWIERKLASAPPLSGEQIARLRALLPPEVGTERLGVSAGSAGSGLPNIPAPG